ncbi:MAG TPA: enoyl-CoA hydratase/isomerase family protein [Nannocystis sp.]
MRVRCEESASVWRLSLGPGPDGHVTLDPAVCEALSAAVERAVAAGPRVLVIASEGPEFCAGMDLAAALSIPAAELRQSLGRFERCLGLLAEAGLATVAVVHGPASGGGVGLLAACDVVIAGPDASFALPELRYGLVPALILPHLQARIGARRVRALALTGEALPAAQAAAWGLVDVLAEDPNAALHGLVRGLLRARPQAVATLKRLTAGDLRGAGLESEPAAHTGAGQGSAGAGQGSELTGAARTAADLEDPELRAALGGLLAEGVAPPWFTRLKGQV